jgi:hypothetical protein
MAKSRAIEKQINQDKRAGTSIIKLLLLGDFTQHCYEITLLFSGAGECGKSTVLKQMQILHSNGFSEEEIAERKAVVYSNTVTSMAAILKAMDNVLHIPLEDSSREVSLLLQALP